VSLVLHRGERLALVGANGSGKTTLLRLLHGLQRPSEGGRTVAPLAPEGRMPHAAMVFQRPFLLDLSVRANVRVGLWLAGVRGACVGQRTQEALARVGLLALQRRRARELSAGQQQRLALARAWALRPDLLLLDEPTASLDPGAKQEVEALVAEFAGEGMTLVMSTHNLGQAKRLSTQVAYLEHGRIAAHGPTDWFFHGEGLPAAAQQFLKRELPWTR
jgi:tungstate transport system ATP-binding protein